LKSNKTLHNIIFLVPDWQHE